jgi:dTDP-glucose pyrophosphorylase/predicted transcriptional regulator
VVLLNHLIREKYQLVIDAIEAIESSDYRICLVRESDETIIGTITDGDIRRHLLDGGKLTSKLEVIMNKNPLFTTPGMSKTEIIDLMTRRNVLVLPLLDSKRKLMKLVHLRDLQIENNIETKKNIFDAAVILAGGEGKRLAPLTNDIPKPMLLIGGAPILERIISTLRDHGIQKIYLSVNYLKEQIISHFESGEDFGVSIHYLEEKAKLGTAGSLSLLTNEAFENILVINGDIYSNIKLDSLLEFHTKNKADLTVCGFMYDFRVPYGVISVKKGQILSIEEKPSFEFLCNAGIYAVSNKILNLVPRNIFFDMPELINSCLREKLKVTAFPVYENWNDIGSFEDLSRVQSEYLKSQLIEKMKGTEKDAR